MPGSLPFPAPLVGLHLVADLASALPLDDAAGIERTLRRAAAAAGVTVLDVRLHHFGPGHGVTGVALLAESHISIHTWPEHGLAAVDIFVCGPAARPQEALAVIVADFSAEVLRQQTIERLGGAVPPVSPERALLR